MALVVEHLERAVAGHTAQSRWAYFDLRRYRKHELDGMDPVPGKLYIGLHESSPSIHSPDFRDVMVPRFFQRRLEQWNDDRERKDRHHVDLVRKIMTLRNKIYASRSFPSHLRLIIMERDEYRCQKCLRDRSTLERLGRHLEVDHIKPFVDGGQTTYANGVTLCDECNNGKHHMKRYQQAMHELGSMNRHGIARHFGAL